MRYFNYRMKTGNTFSLLFCLVVLCQIGCSPKMVPVSKSVVQYDSVNDRTVYTVEPYGNISLPGKWIEGKYNSSTKQQYFYHKDTVTAIVTVGACSGYPFAKDKAEGYEFVKKYYESETKYQTQMLEQHPKLMVEDEKNRYMIWMVRQDGIDQYYLCGVKDCACNECSYRAINLKSRKYTAEKAKAFLTDVFLNH